MYYVAEFIEDGDGYVVTFPAFPEANTGGKDLQQALENAKEALELTILTYVKDGRALPSPDDRRPAGGGYHSIAVPAQVLAKKALIESFRASGLTQSAFARRLGKAETEVRRMLDPYHATKLKSIENGLRALGKHLVVGVEELA